MSEIKEETEVGVYVYELSMPNQIFRLESEWELLAPDLRVVQENLERIKNVDLRDYDLPGGGTLAVDYSTWEVFVHFSSYSLPERRFVLFEMFYDPYAEEILTVSEMRERVRYYMAVAANLEPVKKGE